MNQVNENINEDMSDCELINVDSMDFSDDQTCLYKVPDDSGERVDMMDWILSCEWPESGDPEYLKTETELYEEIDNILKNDAVSTPDKHKFDSRTFVRPRRTPRPGLQHVLESSPPSDRSDRQSDDRSGNKYLTYNKYNNPILRLKTFNVDTDSANSSAAKEFAIKRRSLLREDDDDIQLEDIETTLASDASGRLSEPAPTRPIQIDLSQPAHNLHNTFNKGMSNFMNDRNSLNMFRSGESLMRMSPPSLVSSIQMESSGNYNMESLEGRRSSVEHKDTGNSTNAPPATMGRESMDPMLTSMTMSILDEKDMNTSFLSQSTLPENDSLLDSLPPSLVSSVNSSFMGPNIRSRTDSGHEANIFSSATFTHLEQSERLLASRPRHQMYHSYTKKESSLRGSESYVKYRNEDTPPEAKGSNDADETFTLYANNKFQRSRHAEKENLNCTFEKDDAFYRNMGVNTQNVVHAAQVVEAPVSSPGRGSLNITLDKQELNEIIQARQKLSLARKALPAAQTAEPAQIIQLPNQTISIPRQSMETAAELLARRKAMNGNSEVVRRAPERNATFKKASPMRPSLDSTVVMQKPIADDVQDQGKEEEHVIDINSATMNLVDADRTLQQEEWGLQQRAMVGSAESTDTGTFSSCSPPDSGPDAASDIRASVASTPLVAMQRGSHGALLQQLHHTISPILDLKDDVKGDKPPAEKTSINSATIVRRPAAAKRDILAGRAPPTSTASHDSVVPSVTVLRRTGLPTSKLRQYSSHKELSRIPGSNPLPARASLNIRGGAGGTGLARRGVYASNPALSPTDAAPFAPLRRDSHTITKEEPECSSEPPSAPPAPPALVRQGTETLRRDRPRAMPNAPTAPTATGTRDLRFGMPPTAYVPSRNNTYLPTAAAARPGPPATAVARSSRPSSVPAPRPVPAPPAAESRPASGLPRPSRLPAPRRALRPPSVYSVAPSADADHY